MKTPLIFRGLSARLLLLAACAISWLAPTGLAADGQIDLNPSATSTTVISAPGSYVLVRNVTMTSDVVCISITSDNVSIDLNGHTLTGMGAASTAGAIIASGDAISVEDGRIVNFGGDGISAGYQAAIKDVLVEGCAHGISVGDFAVISGVTSRLNRKHGISIGDKGRVQSCMAISNGSLGGFSGIHLGKNSSALDCMASLNTAATGSVYGIHAEGIECVIERNAVADNEATTGQSIGILAADSANIRNNLVKSNFGSTAASGITANAGSLVAENLCYSNKCFTSGTSYGILTGVANSIMDNLCYDNTEGPTGTSLGVGIFAGHQSRVHGNVSRRNGNASGGATARGIMTTTGCDIRNNMCADNDSASGGDARGIDTQSGCHVTENYASHNTATGGGTSYGIFLTTDSYVADNMTRDHNTAGIRLDSAVNRSEMNRLAGPSGISDVGGNNLGTGDRADEVY